MGAASRCRHGPKALLLLLQPLQPHPALQPSEEKFLVRARARRMNSKGQFQRGAACALCVCEVCAWLWGAPLLCLWDLLEPGWSVLSAWGGAGAATEPWGGPWPGPGVGLGSGGWLMLPHPPQTKTPTCCRTPPGSRTRQSRTSDVGGPHPSVTVFLPRALPPFGFGSPLPDPSQLPAAEPVLQDALPHNAHPMALGMSTEGGVPAEKPRNCTQQKAKSLACSFPAFLCQAFIQRGMSSPVLSSQPCSGSCVCP